MVTIARKDDMCLVRATPNLFSLLHTSFSLFLDFTVEFLIPGHGVPEPEGSALLRVTG